VSAYEREHRTIVAGKETVLRRRGADWSFHLPERHTVELTDDGHYINVATPQESSLYKVDRVDDSDPEEVVVFLGEEHGKAGPPSFGPGVAEARGYPLPEIQDEFERLRARWRNAGLDEQEFIAYPAGATHEDKLREIRRRLRQAEPPSF
jgi:hypothetical protein